MGFLSLTLGGLGFIMIGVHEALLIASPSSSQTKQRKTLSSIFLVLFCSLFILNSLISLFDAHSSNDAVGTVLQLQLLPVAFLFLLHSLLLLFPIPSPFLSLLALFAFAEEFLLFYLQRKDPSGVENRYYDLLLVPIGICVLCTALELGSSRGPREGPRLGRAVGLVLQGTWLIQMALSLFTKLVAMGCTLHRVSRGNYSLRCRGHPEYHRARAIATLQFNCHLALLVVLLVGGFSVVASRNGGLSFDSIDAIASSTRYARLGGAAELQPFEHSPNFTLDSGDDDDEEEETRVGGDVESKKVAIAEHAATNGNGLAPPTAE